MRKLSHYNLENYTDVMREMWRSGWGDCIAAVECNYQGVDRELKEQFIHGLNDKYMLEEIIEE